MSDTENSKAPAESPPPVVAPPTADVEAGGGIEVAAIKRPWKREEILQKGSVALRGLGFLFSLLAFIIMASNKHGDLKDFDKYEEYRYLLAISILSTLYTGGQVLRHFHEFSAGKQIMKRWTSAMIDFFGDQLISYLLISSTSTAIPLTSRMREPNYNLFTDSSADYMSMATEPNDNLFTDSSAASISMAFIAFFWLGLSSLVSGYKLSTQSYI